MFVENEHQTGKADGEMERKEERTEVPLHVARFIQHSVEVTHISDPYPKLYDPAS